MRSLNRDKTAGGAIKGNVKSAVQKTSTFSLLLPSYVEITLPLPSECTLA